MAAKDVVETTILDNKIAIFSKSYCPYCKRAKALFAAKFPDVPTKIHELDLLGEEGSAIQQYLLEKTGQRTVPNIFINEKFIGGCDSVTSLDQEGKLAGLIAA
ncbi:glutaredoxin [Sparassis latifolia]|uniref:Glutaredoxin-1 n=1 Tax=Sparassis crispa TaxID=139825 RepID=A0A401G5N5_9APHY|nr:Glutaredoxin-1 [Sparassis crispa]GBE77469.1 Glutaredoxin-1 [Sparassis crispa]